MSEAAIGAGARRAVAARAPFIFVIFLGSFLLFLIQPMFGRMMPFAGERYPFQKPRALLAL